MTGKIVRVAGKGYYGFIKGEDGREYFFHSSAFTPRKRFTDQEFADLKGSTIEFEPHEGEGKGPRAETITF